MAYDHTLAHALKPKSSGCTHSMYEIAQCVICGKWLTLHRKHVDVCGKRCFSRLLRLQVRT